MDPFHFNTKLDQRASPRVRANTMEHLLAGVGSLPDSSIYFIPSLLHQHQYLSPEPPQRLCYWISNILGDELWGNDYGAWTSSRFQQVTNGDKH